MTTIMIRSCACNAYIMHGSVRDNVLLAQPYDAEFMGEVGGVLAEFHELQGRASYVLYLCIVVCGLLVRSGSPLFCVLPSAAAAATAAQILPDVGLKTRQPCPQVTLAL
jgi:hypothetical protein